MHCSLGLLITADFAAMALSILGFLVLLVVGQADEILQVPLGVKTPTSVHSINSTDGISSAWSNFVHCKCGFSCAKELGSWYIFSLGQSCSCNTCPTTNTTAMLRGTISSKQSQAAESRESSETCENQRSSLGQPTAPAVAEMTQTTWDNDYLHGFNFLRCAWL